MIGRIMAFSTCLIAAVLLFLMGWINKGTKEPIRYIGGDKSIKYKIKKKNTKKYNEEIISLYKKDSIMVLVSGIGFLIHAYLGIGLIIFSFTVGSYISFQRYEKVIEKYS